MADTAVHTTTLTAGTVSADLVADTADTVSVATGDTAVIDVANVTDRVLVTLSGGGAATATLVAGDNPPALKAGLGNGSAQTIASGAVYALAVDAGRYMHDDGKIRILIGGTGPVLVGAIVIPKTI